MMTVLEAAVHSIVLFFRHHVWFFMFTYWLTFFNTLQLLES